MKYILFLLISLHFATFTLANEGIRQLEGDSVSISIDKISFCTDASSNDLMVDNVEVPPLIAAIVDGDIDRIKLLLERGSSVEEEDISEMTPLMHAFHLCDYKITELLLEHGANPYEIYLVPYLGHSYALYYLPYSSTCLLDLLDKYKDQWKTYEMLDGQIAEDKLAWIVECDINGYEWLGWLIGLVGGNLYVKTKIAEVSNINVVPEYIPPTVGYGSLFKHVAFRLSNGSTFSYSGDNVILDDSEKQTGRREYKNYINRLHGIYELGFDATLMGKAIEITKEKWDMRKESWDGRYYDDRTHTCHHYIYDDTIKIYLGLGGILYLKKNSDLGRLGKVANKLINSKYVNYVVFILADKIIDLVSRNVL